MRVGATIFNQNYADWDRYEAEEKGQPVAARPALSDREIFNQELNLARIADETGGRVIDVGNNGQKLQAAFDQIQDELRTQYVASYTSTNEKLDGGFRHLAVQCGDGMKVAVRKGYYAAAPPQP